MRYALNGMCFPYSEAARNYELAAAAGYDGVEPVLDLEEIDEDEANRLANLAEQHDLSVPSMTTPTFWQYPLSATEEETREHAIEIGQQAIRMAAALGAETLLVVPGVVDESTRYDEAYENALTGVKTLAETAQAHDITLGIENVWNDFLLSPLEFRDFIDSAGRAGPVKAYFDVGNVLRFGYPDGWIRILGDRIAAVHVKDYDPEIDTIQGFTYPLHGGVDWEAVTQALADIGYDGWIAPEVSPYETHGERMPGQVLENLHSVF